MMALRDRHREPSPEQLAIAESDGQIRTAEATGFNPAEFAELRDFQDKVLEDGLWKAYFQPEYYDQQGNMHKSTFYHEAYQPLYLYFSRSLSLGNMNPAQIKHLLSKIDDAAQHCYKLAEDLEDDPVKVRRIQANIESMVNFLSSKIPAHSGNNGFFLRTMFEMRKTFTMIRGDQEKKGWFHL